MKSCYVECRFSPAPASPSPRQSGKRARRALSQPSPTTVAAQPQPVVTFTSRPGRRTAMIQAPAVLHSRRAASTAGAQRDITLSPARTAPSGAELPARATRHQAVRSRQQPVPAAAVRAVVRAAAPAAAPAFDRVQTLFAQTVVLWSDGDNAMSFRTWVSRVDHSLLGQSYRHLRGADVVTLVSMR